VRPKRVIYWSNVMKVQDYKNQKTELYPHSQKFPGV